MSLGVTLQPEPLAESRDFLVPLAQFVLGFAAVVFVGRLLVVPAVVRVVRARNRRNPTVQQAVERYLRILVLVVALAVALATAGYGDVLTRSTLIVAAVTVAIGVAGQEVIGNLVSGMFLVADSDFNVGDWVSWDENEGVVEEVMFRVTRIRTPGNEVLTVPNTELTTTAITTPYSRDRIRVSEPVAVEYETDIREATEVLREAAAVETRVLDDPTPSVTFSGFGDDAIELEVRYWLADPTRRTVSSVRQAVAGEIQARLEAADIVLSPASQRELSGELAVSDAGDRRA